MIGHFIKKKKTEITAKAFLETPSENDPIFSAVIKGLYDSYNVDDEKWSQEVADDVQNAVMVAFNETISEDHLKKLLERTNLLDNCKVVQAKLVNPVIFSVVSPAIRSSDIKLRYMQLLARLSDAFRSKPNVKDMKPKTEIIQIILDGLKIAGHRNHSMKPLFCRE